MAKKKEVEGQVEEQGLKDAVLPADPSEVAKNIAGFVAKFDKPNINARTMLLSDLFWTGVVANMFGMETPPVNPPTEPVIPEVEAPTLVSIEPDSAVIGDDDFVMRCTGTGFTEESVIVFNGGDEPTSFVSETEVTTIVDPATAGTAGSYPVFVRTGEATTASLFFTFTEMVRSKKK